VSNDLFREARAEGIELDRVRVTVRGDFSGDPPVSTDVVYDLELEGDAPRDRLEALVARVDGIAEIPNSLRLGTPVTLGALRIG
jgi:putative redox protein